jgi:hypothetical protein
MEYSTDDAPVQSTSFLDVPTDDDEISIFVKDIDARKRLNAQRQPSLPRLHRADLLPHHTPNLTP